MKISAKFQEDFFDKEDNQYDHRLILKPPAHTMYELKLLEKPLTKNNVKTVVDFGAGTGRCAIYLSGKNYDVTAVDISKKSLRILQKIAPLKVSLKIPENKKFDAIVGADILHHITFEEFFGQFYSSLKKGGIISFSEPNAVNIFWYIFHIYHALLKKKNLFNHLRAERGLLQCRYFHIISLLRNTGFKDVHLTGYGLLPPPIFNRLPFFEKINRQMGAVPILKFFAYRFIIYAKK